MNNQQMMELTTVEKSEFEQLVSECTRSGSIDSNLYIEYDVKRGLRDSNGNGVLTGLTEISDVCGCHSVNGRKIPVDGELYFQGYNVEDIIKGSSRDRFRFEEVTYLLLFGSLPDDKQFESFLRILTDLQELSGAFIRDVIMKATSANLMNSLMKSILSLYSYDENPDDISVPNVLRQSLQLIAKMPLLAVYAYQAYRHYKLDGTLMIKNPKKGYSTAENILYMLRDDGQFSELEAKVLDICLVLHAEHGGGNNSSFTTHLVSSSGTDTYSTISAAVGSLKGPKHGGANIAVINMIEDIKKEVKDITDYNEVEDYLVRVLKKEANNKSGLVYGMGHAIYTLSDPRAKILKEMARKLAQSNDKMDDFLLCDFIETKTPELQRQMTGVEKPMCANVDLYSGFVYEALGIPPEIATPLFATARLSGWCAHRLEELTIGKKLMRPAYDCVEEHREYIEIGKR